MAKKLKEQKATFNSYTIYFMFTIVIVLLITFCIQLKIESDDKLIHIAMFNEKQIKQLKQLKQEPKTNQVIQVTKQIDVIKTNKDTNQKIAKNIENYQKRPFDGYMFSTIQNWGNKKQMQEQLKKQTNKNIPAFAKQLKPKRNPANPSANQIEPANNNLQTQPHNLPPKTVSAVPRAGITPPQIDLAKRLQNLKNLPPNSELAAQQKNYFEQKYNISKYEQLPFCIVIPSYNNSAQNRYINNMNSILQQDYSNYHIVFIDDASQDGTGRLVQKYVAEHQISKQKIKIIINQKRTMAMPNIYRASKEFCKPYELFVIIDGDDELVGRQVLKHFNSLFQSKNVWVAYTNFISIRGSVGYSRPYSQTVVERNAFRKSGFVISHLRVFYTKLLALVKEDDLKDEDKHWFRAANDVAMYMPILEMTHRRVIYCPELSYLYNSNTGLNNHKSKLKEQKGNQKKVKAKASYKQLEQLLTVQQKQQLKNSMNKKVQIKDTSLPKVGENVKIYGWEM